MSKNQLFFQKTHEIGNQFTLDFCDTANAWTESTDVSNVGTSTNHKVGENSISFDKDGTSEAFALLENPAIN